MSVRSWTARIAGAANERSKWRLYSRRKRVLWATGLSIEVMVIVAVLAWLFGRTVHDTVGVGAAASAAAIWGVSMVWLLALVPERAPGWVVIWWPPGMILTILVIGALADALR